MSCSPEQYASNLQNSRKSTGPASPETKARVRKNALKHGLTGAGIVVPDEDVAVIQERFEDFDADLNPRGVVSEFLIRYLALTSVRMDRCARHEAACLNQKMLLAQRAEANLDRIELKAQVDRLADEPEAACRDLEGSTRGVAWMIASWECLRAALLDPDAERWGLAEIELAENLAGRRLVALSSSRIVVLSGAYHGHLDDLDDWPDLPAVERSLTAQAELARIIDSEIERLKDVLAGSDDAERTKREADAMALALFDASKEAVLARKYAGAAERAFFKTLKTIQELNASAIVNELAEAEGASPEPETESEKMALNFPLEPIVEGPPKRRPPAPADRRKSKARETRRSSERLRE